MTDQSQPTWRKAALSAHNGGCVEIAALPRTVGVRDSKRIGAGAHVVSRAAFADFLADVTNGRYDL